MNALAQKYMHDVEGIIPDIADGLDPETDQPDIWDSVYDYAADHIYAAACGDATPDEVREAATQITDHYIGTRR